MESQPLVPETLEEWLRLQREVEERVLMTDPVSGRYGGLTSEELLSVAESAAREGADLCARPSGTLPSALIPQLGASFAWTDQPSWQSGVRIRSEYHSRDARILIYRQAVQNLQEAIARCSAVRLFPPDLVPELLLAHELFHHLEVTHLGPTSRRREVCILRLGALAIRSGIRSLSELAAHRFGRVCLELPLSPILLDTLDYIVRPDVPAGSRSGGRLI